LSNAIASFRHVFVVVGGFSVAINVLLLAPALYMLQTYDRVLTSRNESTLLLLTLLLVGLLALEGALEFIRSRVLARLSATLDMQLGRRVFDAMLTHSLTGKGHATQALGELASARQFLTGRGLLAFFDAPWLPVQLVVVFLLSPWLGLFALVSTLLLILLAWYNEHATADLHTLSSKHGASATHLAGSTLANVEVVTALGMGDALRERWMVRQREYLAVLGEATDRGGKIGSLVRVFRLVLQSGILGVGAWLALMDQLTPGGMIAASILLGRALAPLDLAIASWRSVVAARNAFVRLNELLAAYPEVHRQVTLPQPIGAVSVEGLVLTAPGRNDVILRGLNFQVAAGKAIAIIGPSGSGKSSLARALVGVWPAQAGTVRLDGSDLLGWDREVLGPYLGYLPQDVELFAGTVAENIARFGTLDSAKIIDAAQRAGVHELVLRLSHGYETVIGEGGLVLSGGQRQRLGLARALYGDPVLVVLDEPNASLDEAGEAALIAALRDLRARARTVFVVTHRTNLLAQTDGVMVLGDGGIKAFGSPSELISIPRKPQEGQVREMNRAAAPPVSVASAPIRAGGSIS
jgi:PrtD family type I secretion system ABC transporter